jgi:hypothetical protein
MRCASTSCLLELSTQPIRQGEEQLRAGSEEVGLKLELQKPDLHCYKTVLKDIRVGTLLEQTVVGLGGTR